MNGYWNQWIRSSDLESLNGSFMEHTWGWAWTTILPMYKQDNWQPRYSTLVIGGTLQ